jgi:transposase-like protein
LKRHRHSSAEIAEKLAQANSLSAEGKNQGDIARALGVSVMTYHRWRKARMQPSSSAEPTLISVAPADETEEIRNLRVENSRLRRLVTDLLLEKLKLEEGRIDLSSRGAPG